MKSEKLAKRLEELLIDGKWIANTNFRELLETIDRDLAQLKLGQHNSIEALVFHVSYYLDGILEAFETNELNIKDAMSFDFIPSNSKEEWTERKRQFYLSSVRFIEVVKTFSNEELEQTFFKEDYGSLERNIEAQIEHSYYHLGQISLLKKLLKN